MHSKKNACHSRNDNLITRPTKCLETFMIFFKFRFATVFSMVFLLVFQKKSQFNRIRRHVMMGKNKLKKSSFMFPTLDTNNYLILIFNQIFA